MWEKLINTGGAQLGFNLFNHETSCPSGAEGVRLLHLHELFPGVQLSQEFQQGKVEGK